MVIVFFYNYYSLLEIRFSLFGDTGDVLNTSQFLP